MCQEIYVTGVYTVHGEKKHIGWSKTAQPAMRPGEVSLPRDFFKALKKARDEKIRTANMLNGAPTAFLGQKHLIGATRLFKAKPFQTSAVANTWVFLTLAKRDCYPTRSFTCNYS
jgi:hypothetical protein